MADKKISDLTEAASVAANDWLLIENSGGNSRKVTRANLFAIDGAKVRKSATLSAQNLTAGPTVTWNTEDWDTGSYHDNASNTDRLTATNAGYYEAAAFVRFSNITSGDPAQTTIQRFNSSGVFQETVATQRASVSATQAYCAVYGQCLMAAGDYLVTIVVVSTDTSVDIHSDSNFLIRRIG